MLPSVTRSVSVKATLVSGSSRRRSAVERLTRTPSLAHWAAELSLFSGLLVALLAALRGVDPEQSYVLPQLPLLTGKDVLYRSVVLPSAVENLQLKEEYSLR